MKDINEMIPYLTNIIEGLGKHFGESVEFVIHDYSKDFSETIVAISNGSVSGRQVGKGGTSVGLKVMQGEEVENGVFGYISQTKDGRYMKSSTIYLKDDNDRVMGSLCVNCDITDAMIARNFINSYCDFQVEKKVETVVYDNVEDLLIALINESINHVGTPVALMTREQKIEGIKYLKSKGGFKIKNASIIVAKYYDISRYTIYNYLNASDSEDIKQ